LYEEGQSDKGSCVDVNECNTGHDRCDENALCINEPGSYQCRCKAGYSGDGFTCQRELPEFFSKKLTNLFDCGLCGTGETACMRVRCTANSQCVETSDGSAECLCLPGYREVDVPGVSRCQPVSVEHSGPAGSSPDCRQTDICDVNALCEYDNREDAFRCRCQRGFTGDGVVCKPQSGLSV
jgi:EGF domain/MSP1 EGF domain 1